MASLSGYALPPTLTSSSSTMRVLFGADATEQRQGFNASYIILPGTSPPTTTPGAPASATPTFAGIGAPCSGSVQLTAASGVLTDGSGPYSANANCEWMITTTPGRHIVLIFDLFNLEAGYDFVRVYDGTTLVVSLTGSTLPFPVTSSSNAVTVKFNADSSVHNSGFSLTYTTPNASDVTPAVGYTSSPVALASLDSCQPSVQYTAAEGVLTDGSGPYSANANCEWTITTTPDRHVVLTFALFSLEQGYDVLDVYDSGAVMKLSGPTLPAPIVSSGSELRVVFTSDGSVHADGFVARYTLTAPTASSSPAVAVSRAGSGDVQIFAASTDRPQSVAASALLARGSTELDTPKADAAARKPWIPFVLGGVALGVVSALLTLSALWHRQRNSSSAAEVHPCSVTELPPMRDASVRVPRNAWGEEQSAGPAASVSTVSALPIDIPTNSPTDRPKKRSRLEEQPEWTENSVFTSLTRPEEQPEWNVCCSNAPEPKATHTHKSHGVCVAAAVEQVEFLDVESNGGSVDATPRAELVSLDFLTRRTKTCALERLPTAVD